jgi:hypothetical protein
VVKKKNLKIEGLRIAYLSTHRECFDPNDPANIATFEHPIQAKLLLTKEILSLEGTLGSFQAIVSPLQVAGVIKILQMLKPTTLVEEINMKSSILEEAYLAIGQEIRESIPDTPPVTIRKKEINFTVVQASCILVLGETIEFRRKWGYVTGPFPWVPSSHIHAEIHGLSAHIEENHKIKVKSLLIFHHHLATQPEIEHSSLFKSAKESFFSDFFRGKSTTEYWTIDPNTHHFCNKPIIAFHKAREGFGPSPPVSFRPSKRDIKIIQQKSSLSVKVTPFELFLDWVLVNDLQHFLDFLPESEQSSSNLNLTVDIPLVRICFFPNLSSHKAPLHEFCLCNYNSWKIVTEFMWPHLILHGGLDGTIAQVDSYIQKDDEIDVLLTINHIKLTLKPQVPQHAELFENPREAEAYSYYEQGQGIITIPRNKLISEPYASLSDSVLFHNEQRDKLSESVYINRAQSVMQFEIDSLCVKIDPISLERCMSIKFETKRKRSVKKVATKLKIDSFNLEFVEKTLNDDTSCPFTAINMLPTYSAISCYSLDSSVSRTLMHRDIRKPLISTMFSRIEMLILDNCTQPKQLSMSLEVEEIKSMRGNDSSVVLSHSFLGCPLTIFLSNTYDTSFLKESKLEVNLRNIVIFLDNVLEFKPYFLTFRTPNRNNEENNLLRVHASFSNLYLDYIENGTRAVVALENAYLSTASTNSSGSNGVHATVHSLQLNLLSRASERDTYWNLRKSINSYLAEIGFVRIASVDLIELFVTVIKGLGDSDHEVADSDCPPFLDCLVNSEHCEHLGDSLYLSQSVRSSVLKEDLLELHLNIGSLLINCCKDSIEALTKMIKLPTNSGSDPELVIRKDSDLSSDDSDTYTIRNSGLTIDPHNPKRIRNINLLDYMHDNPHNQLSESQPVISLEVPKSDSKVSQVVHSHIQIPGIIKPNTVDSSYHALKAHHGFPKMRVSLSLSHFSFILYGGQDFAWNSRNQPIQRRSQTQSIQCKFEGLGLAYTKFPRKLHYAWRLTFTIENMEILDYIHFSAVNKILHYDKTFSREPSSHMFAMEASAVWPRPTFSEETELIIKCSILPLKLNIDQNFIQFILSISDYKPEENTMMHTQGTTPVLTSSGNPIAYNPDSLCNSSSYIQMLVFSDIHLNIDYIPHRLGGSHPYSTVLNMFQIENLQLLFSKVEINGARDIQTALGKAWQVWYTNFYEKNRLQLVAGLGPFSVVKNLGGALYDLVRVPYSCDDYRTGFKQALVGLLKAVSVEGLRIVESMTSGAYTCLQIVGDWAGIRMPSRQAIIKPLQYAQCTVRYIQIDKNHRELCMDKYKSE